MNNREPQIHGRFNFLPIGNNKYHILFLHESGVSSCVVSNLNYDQMKPTVDEMNESLFILRQELDMDEYQIQKQSKMNENAREKSDLSRTPNDV